MSTIEIFATIFGLLSVYLTVKENVWCWPTGLIMVVLYIFIFFEAKLYSDFILQIIYVFMQVYGWYHWVYGGNKKNDLPVTRLTKMNSALWAVVVVIGTFGVGYAMKTYTNASFPILDSFILAASLVAQWFLTKKFLESWILWITVDVVAIGVYFLKGLYLTSGLYAVFLILAILGLIEWQKSLKKRRQIVTGASAQADAVA